MSDIYTRFVSSILFPLHEHMKGHDSVKIRKNLEESQWWGPDRLKQTQIIRLKKLLTDASAHVPYYRNLFKKIGFKPDRLNSLSDLTALPMLDKKIIRSHLDDLKADNAKGLSRFNTGGSSGEPLIFYIGKERVSHDVAEKWRATRWWGVDIGDPEIVVWGSPIELGAQDRVRATRDKLFRTHLLPAFEMSRQNLDKFVEQIRRIRPKMLFGYPSALSRIALHARQIGCVLNDLGISVAFVTSEKLYEEQRKIIGDVFGCPVANGYGSRDAGFIAHECPAGGMHITSEDIIVELVDEQGYAVPQGEAGEIVVTHLATRDFPFIRYKTGDVAVFSNSQCLCGRRLPLISDIQGRTTDFVIAKNGTQIHGLALVYVIRSLPGIYQFKIIQESIELTHVLLVPDDAYLPGHTETIRAGFQERLGQGVKINIKLVESISPESSGKYRYVVSKVTH